MESDEAAGNGEAAPQAEVASEQGDRPDVLLRAARHHGDLSQRELAARAGVTQTTVTRIESGRVVSPGYQLMVRLLSAAGVRLLPVTGPGRALAQRPFDDVLDAGHRHWPSHLDVREVRSWDDWWRSMWLTDMRPLPPYTTDRRETRDYRRWQATRRGTE